MKWNPLWLPAFLLLSYIGTAPGKKILDRFSDENFRMYSRVLVFIIGIYYLYKAFELWELPPFNFTFPL